VTPPSAAGVLMIAAAGAVGTLARFGLVSLTQAFLPQPTAPSVPAFPWGTLAVNLIGCLAMGILATALAQSVREDLRLALLVGLLGGFTTFSAFAWETHTLLTAGRPLAALLYVLASVALGIILVFAGARIA
jgi:fluoride exporter